jgi:hypothetical protein
MVEVGVREENGADPCEFGRGERYTPPEVPHPGTKDGVRQQADPVQLDQDGCVPDEEEPARDGLCTHPGISRRVRRESRDHEHVERDERIAQTGWYGMKKKLPANAANPTVQPLTSRVAIAPPFLIFH